MIDVLAKTQAFFDAVICDDLATKTLINLSSSNITFKKGPLVFDLSSLHKIIFPLDEVDYSEFKKILYSSELNKNLMKQGAQVVLWQHSNKTTKGKVDTNLYCLHIDVKLMNS